LNTEIGKTGEVIVEGHVIGRLDGFTFAPDAAEAGSDAKALQAAALKALAGEIEARAEKLSNAPDDQFVLASDGTLRWTGDAVARLVAADDVLHPRLRIISDDRLSGAPRDAVQTRLDLWLKTHIEKLLGPLFDLTKAEDITGIARGIAFQLTEALGVLERQKITSEMKDLDQPSRATLRKYGVRFGAYHIYVPALLKPAARALALLLWAQKQDNVDMSALSTAQHLAGSGRTSFPVDKLLDRDAYRILGYRQCGERAVRVDILERLADLIRPALSWREASPGDKPAGAFDGRSFVVTQAMTSLTGSAGEDFASILRALGYRMEKRLPLPPAPPRPVAATTPVEVVAADAVSSESASSDAAPSEDAVVAGDALAEEPAIAVETQEIADITNDAPAVDAVIASPSAALLPGVDLVPNTASEQAAVELQPDPATAPVEAAAPTEEAASAGEPAAETEAVAADASSADAAAEAVAPVEAAAPDMVEVWRPGGRSEERRPPRHDRNRHQRNANPSNVAAAAEGEAPADGAKRERTGDRPRRDRSEFRRPRPDAPAANAAAPAEGAPNRGPRDNDNKGRPPRERFGDKGRGDRPPGDKSFGDRNKGKFKGGDRDKGGRPDRNDRNSGGATRPYASSAAPRERDRPIDPNSPFAKLAALKEQLTARKD
ncbi:MAG: helicase-like, partial [Tardiphaga sp.]|nr:helicase-like [Tardiphaga sp.]